MEQKKIKRSRAISLTVRQRRQDLPKPSFKAQVARPGRHVELGRFHLTWIYAISMWLVPILSMYTSMGEPTSPPLVLSTTWVFVELWLGLNTLIRGQSHADYFQRSSIRVGAALLLWVVSDLYDPLRLAPWIIGKITLGYVIISSLHWQQVRQVFIIDTQESKQLGLMKLASIMGFLCGLSMICFWKSTVIFSISGSLMLMLNQSAYLAFTLSVWSYVSGRAPKLPLKIPTKLLVVLGLAQLGGSLLAVIAPEVIHERLMPFMSSGILMVYSVSLIGKIIDFTVIERALLTPWRALSISILSLCILGSVLLMTPMAELGGQGLTWMEAVFTSVSASCITGLSIIDLSQMNFTGQLLILSLIQVGGFGVILITHMIISISADRYSFYVHNLTHSVVGKEFTPLSYARDLLIFVITVEAISACSLSLFFLEEGHSLSHAIWLGCFTAISAFCNAGFALQSNSFMDYAHHTPILTIISLTVIFGGIGPRAIWELISSWRHRRRNQSLSLYTRIILWSNLILLSIPTGWFVITEWDHAFAQFDFIDKLTNAFFHATSLRTAGFNSIDLSHLGDSSWSMSLFLMVIGGSPFSTAGGVKVTTIALVFFSLLPILRGEKQSRLLDRAQSRAHGAKALAILMVSLLAISVATFTLQCLNESLSLKALLFEVVSALGTVGLSQGGTGMLSIGGLIVIMLCMFLGRVGPPALLLSFTSAQEDEHHERPDSYVREELPLS